MEMTSPGRESIRRILERRRQRGRFFYVPQEACHKCGAECWEREGNGSWYCFRCGNLGYVRAGETAETPVFVQQSDLRGGEPG